MMGYTGLFMSKCKICGQKFFEDERILNYYGYFIHDSFGCKIKVINEILRKGQ